MGRSTVKNNNTYWFVTASSAREIRVIVPDTKTNTLKKIINLLNFLFKKFVVENMHHTSVFCQFGFTGKEITTVTAVCISEEKMRR